MNEVFAFEVTVEGFPPVIYNHRTAGKAKTLAFRDLSASYESYRYTDLHVRKLGAPYSSERFISNAEYRGLPNARCGQRVVVGNKMGVIVGHNSSANFNILFDEDAPEFAGMILNVHPSEVQFEETA